MNMQKTRLFIHRPRVCPPPCHSLDGMVIIYAKNCGVL